ncbi:MAG: hypothetical protein MUF86_03635 [Akkermansiaceae bacterium]|nr:hypothetical protein [Akkermansiaceae bacterium]
MSDSENNPLNDLLSSFALGPSWARATGTGQEKRADKPDARSGDRPPRREERRDDGRKGGFRERDGERRPQRGPRSGGDDRYGGPPRHEEAAPAEGVRVILIPDAQALHLIGKEVHQVARVYPLFDVAKILLAERGRCRAVFETAEPHPPLLRGKLDESLFLTREEAVRHLWQSELRVKFIEEEIIEVDPPKGNFQIVAKCGLTGLWLGPPNFHAYQTNLRRIHRECFPGMPFAAYSSKVRTERGEEAVNAWLDTMKKKTRWRIQGDGDDAWIEDLAEAQRVLAARCFDQAFEETRHAEVLASIPPKNLSPSLMTSLKIAGNHARNHPAILIPAVCKAVEAEHLPVFKRQGKLFTGPARPHPLPPGQTLAERPAIMVEWIRANKPAKLEGLWKAVLPEGGTAPPAEFAADLFWLLHQGHILLFTDDTLVVQEIREAPQPPKEGEARTGKTKKRKAKKPKPDTVAAPDAGTTADESPDEDADITAAETFVEAPVVESPVVEAPVVEAPVVVAPVVETALFETAEKSPPNPEPGVDEPQSL